MGVDFGAWAVDSLRRMVKRGYPQAEVARRAGVARSTVYGVLQGKHGLSNKVGQRVLSNLGRDYRVNVLTGTGQRWLEPASGKEYSTVGEHWKAVEKARQDGDWSALEALRDKPITIVTERGREKMRLPTDRETVRQLGHAGELEPMEVTRGGSNPSSAAREGR